VARIDHIQIAAPQGCESAAKEFYGTLLGMKEIEKPPVLRARGGCWFQCGSQQLHIGVDRNFQPAKKAHPAFAVLHLDELREIFWRSRRESHRGRQPSGHSAVLRGRSMGEPT
jgi:hypothetical protein